MLNSTLPFPKLDKGEQKILDELRATGGDIFRTELRRRIKGSNTTFQKRISSLKKKGVIEEYKREDGRLRTAYRFTEHASRVYGLERILSMEKWFSASQRIELFPEFDQVSRLFTPGSKSPYEILGIEPRHLLAEVVLAVSRHPDLREDQLREVLTLSNATLQNIATGRLHKSLEGEVEGYIVFHYRLWKPSQEFADLINRSMTEYLSNSDPIARHRASSKLIELGLRDVSFLETLTLMAASIGKSLGLDADRLLKAYNVLKRGEAATKHDRILTVTELVIGALNVFRELLEKRRSR